MLPTEPPYDPQMDDIFGMEFGISMYLCVCVCVCVLVYATSRGPNVPTSIVKPEIVQTGLRSLQGKLYIYIYIYIKIANRLSVRGRFRVRG